jgi:hypothetical protein
MVAKALSILVEVGGGGVTGNTLKARLQDGRNANASNAREKAMGNLNFFINLQCLNFVENHGLAFGTQPAIFVNPCSGL